MTAAPFTPLNGEWLWHFNLLQNFSRDFKLNASASLLGFSGWGCVFRWLYQKSEKCCEWRERAKGRVAIQAGQQSRWSSSKSVITWFISTASVKDHYRHPDQHRFNCKNSRFKRNNFKLVEQSFWLTFGAVVGEAGAEPIMS